MVEPWLADSASAPHHRASRSRYPIGLDQGSRSSPLFWSDESYCPNRSATLVQGGVIFGLKMALNEEVNIKDGRMVEGNFDQYPILRTGDTPQVNIHFGGLSGHDRFSELGEPPAGPVGPAVGNAIFRAIGKRIRSTPIRKHDLTWA